MEGVSKMCVCVTFHHNWQTSWGRKRVRQKRRGGREGVRKTESLSCRPAVLLTMVWLFIGCRLTERKRLKKREREFGIDRQYVCVCVCEGVGQNTALLFTFLHALTGCSAVAVCVCVRQRQSEFEWGTLTGVKAPISTMGLGHTHIHTQA